MISWAGNQAAPNFTKQPQFSGQQHRFLQLWTLAVYKRLVSPSIENCFPGPTPWTQHCSHSINEKPTAELRGNSSEPRRTVSTEVFNGTLRSCVITSLLSKQKILCFGPKFLFQWQKPLTENTCFILLKKIDWEILLPLPVSLKIQEVSSKPVARWEGNLYFDMDSKMPNEIKHWNLLWKLKSK